MVERKPYPQINTFRDWVVDELQRRKRNWPPPTVTPFVRMTSCNESAGGAHPYRYFTLGLHGFDSDQNLFNLTYGAHRDIVGYAYRGGQKILISADQITYLPPNIQQLQSSPQNNPLRVAANQRIQQAEKQQSQVSAHGAHPIPGITSVNVRRSGLAAPMIADVQWKCYNVQQLEFLRNHFMVVGTYIVIEWGQQFHNKKLEKVLNFSSENIDNELLNTIIRGRRYVIDNYSKPNDGNYDFIVGQLGNFKVTVEPDTNIYTVTTQVISMGENMWGMSSDMTFTNQIATSTDPRASNINDIHEYFGGVGGGQGSRFDQFINGILAKGDTSRAVAPSNNPNLDAQQPKDGDKVSPNPNDLVFISWTAFTNDLINDIIEFFNQPVSAEAKPMLDRLRSELRALLGLGGPPADSLKPDIRDALQKSYDAEWVGYNQWLRSCDPDVMLIITQKVSQGKYAKEWVGSGIFGQEGFSDRAKLEHGIWLNVGMIREAFLSTSNLRSAIQQALSKINEAVAHYWQLQIFFDDELSVYKVIDYKFSDSSKDIPFYVFNSTNNDHHNEVLELDFDTAFPPELITQMMVVSMIQTASPQEQAELFKRYPLINNTSPFMMAVNWTDLRDILKDKLKVARNGGDVTPGQLGNAPIDTTNSAGRLTNTTHKGSNAAEAQALPGASTPTAATTLSQAGVSDASTAAPNPRKIPFAPVFPEIFQMDNLPVEPLIISSRFGSRQPPKVGATSNHKGVDIAVPSGTSVKAVKSGQVIFSGFQNPNDASAGAGLYIKVAHNDGFETLYEHLSNSNVNVGDKITGGQEIGNSGNTGNSTGAHLHFELRSFGKSIDPEPSFATVGKQINYDSPETLAGVSKSQSSDPAAPPSTPVQSSQTTQPSNQQTPPSSEINDYLHKVQEKFGDGMVTLIMPSKSLLRNILTQDGYSNIGKVSNSFVSPFPTKTSVEIKTVGISGVSISDSFMVDKLPFIFASYGAFQTVEITDNIADRGWVTSIRGYFKMLWPDGKGGQRID